METKEAEMTSFAKFKYYTTLIMGLTACLSAFIFFFLVPAVLDPSIGTLMANFDPDPIVCMTVQSDRLVGMKNCSWSSCKEGCTVDQYECDQIYVNYMHMPYSEYDGQTYEENDDVWVVKGTPLFLNIKACGYPPNTNCTIFGELYTPVGAVFPCYYSRATPNMVIMDYSWSGAVNPMIVAFIVPNALAAISLGIVSYWWYPGCQRKKPNGPYELPPDQEEASSSHGDESDDEAVGKCALDEKNKNSGSRQALNKTLDISIAMGDA